nr:protein translocase subunit SecD [Vulcanibacillus modesticaldus]
MIRLNRLLGFIAIIVVLTVLMIATIKPVLNNITLGLDLQGGFEVLYQAIPTDGQEITTQALKETAAAIDRRIDVLGVTEPRIEIEGTDRIRIQLAGVPDQDAARELLGKPAKLTFRNVNNEILLDGSDLVEGGASVDLDKIGRPVVVLKLKDADKFRDITAKYIGQSIGIYLDEELITNPVVNQVISTGDAIITGQETVEEAQELADLLNAGALPLDLKELQSQSVGATLGMKALELTIKAGIIGAIFVLLFMIFYYRVPGIIASYALVVYVYLILVLFWLLHVTLTLPGIAALVLGVGMAIDANIITYERIKEELKSGKSLLSSVRAGSRRSLSTIIDANITTILAAIVLYIFGTSLIRGFAITLIVSIIVSLITAVYGSKLLLNLFVKSNLVTNPRAYGVKEEEISEL